MTTFENTLNGHREYVDGWSVLWALIFGPIYFAFKGVWRHVVIIVLLVFGGILTGGIVSILIWIGYAVAAPSVVRNQYLRNGWREVRG